VSALFDQVIVDALEHAPQANANQRRHNGGPALDADDTETPTFVFSTKVGTHISGFSRAKQRLDAAILEARRQAAEKAGQDPAKTRPMPAWRIHDLRRTAATHMASLGVHPHVIEFALNHVSGTRAGLVSLYQRHDFLAERRAAFDLWARHIVGLVEPQRRGVVVKMRRR
jgi:integrase